MNPRELSIASWVSDSASESSNRPCVVIDAFHQAMSIARWSLSLEFACGHRFLQTTGAARSRHGRAVYVTTRCFRLSAQWCNAVRGRSEWKLPLPKLNRDPFHLGHFLDGITAAFAPEPAVLDAAKRYMRLIGDGAIVDVHHTGFEP